MKGARNLCEFMTPEVFEAAEKKARATLAGRDLTAVYVIGRKGGPSKVGVSSEPMGHLPEVQAGCPFPVEVWGYAFFPSLLVAQQFEQKTRDALNECHLFGDWFVVTPEGALDALESRPGYFDAYVRDHML